MRVMLPMTSTERTKRIVYPLVTFAVVAVLWQVATVRMENRLLVPSFTETARSFVELIGTRELWAALATSNQAMLIGYALSILVGVPLGLALGRFRLLERLTSAYIDLLLVLPVAGLIPLLIVSFGLELTSRVAVVFLFTFIVIVVNTRAGLRDVSPAAVEMAKSYGASERQLWWMVLLPGSLPGIMAGLRIGVARAVSGMIIGELLMFSVGIGQLIQEFSGRLLPSYLYAVVIVVILEALVLIRAADIVEARLLKWRK